MRFIPPLKTAILLKRYKRFLADIKLDDGQLATAHCPNTGAMLTCSAPGSRVGLSSSDNPRRKYNCTLEMIHESGEWIGVNTARANALVIEAIKNGTVTELRGHTRIQKEVRTSSHCRLDLVVYHEESPTFVEVKSCTYVENKVAMFPDAVTERGVKHLRELSGLVRQGYRAAVFFLIQRSDAAFFRPAASIDPLYAKTLKEVHEEGVAILAYRADVSPEGIVINQPLPYSFS
jgi:sugar fermentation stimulation protein A